MKLIIVGLVAVLIVAALASSLRPELTPDQSKHVLALVAQFTSPEFAVRQKAVEELIKMGPAVLPLIRKTLAETKDDEVKLRCEMVIKPFAEQQGRIEAENRKRQAEAEFERRGPELKKRYEAKLAELHKQGEPVTMKEVAPPEIADEQNAAVLYEEAFKEYEEAGADAGARIAQLLRPRPLEPAELEEARELVKQVQPVVKKLREAGYRTSCRFTLNYDVEPACNMILKHLSRLQASARLLALSSKVNLGQGKPDEALVDYEAILRLGHASDREPLVISMLVGIACRGIARKPVMAVLDDSEPSAEALRKVLDSLGDVDDRSPYLAAMRGERCMGISVLKFVFQNPDERIPMFLEPKLKGTKVTVSGLYTDALHYLELMESEVTLSRKPWHQSKADWEKIDHDLQEKATDYPLTTVLGSTLSKTAQIYDRAVAVDGVSQLAVALRLYRLKHGQYPEKLTALVPEVLKKLPTDPFSGKDYEYRREGKGFVVYSIGDDGVDNNGEEGTGNAPDIAFKCSR